MRVLCALILTTCGAAWLSAQTPVHYDLYAHFNTSMGEIVAQLYPNSAPKTVANFVELAEGKKATLTKTGQKITRPFYNGLIFHRVIEGFMIQTGQVADGRSCGVPNLRDEIDIALNFEKAGALAMANAGRKNTGSCQIFITVAPQKGLDGDYTIFGQVVSGQDVAKNISEVPVKNERPVTPVILKSVTIERRPR